MNRNKILDFHSTLPDIAGSKVLIWQGKSKAIALEQDRSRYDILFKPKQIYIKGDYLVAEGIQIDREDSKTELVPLYLVVRL